MKKYSLTLILVLCLFVITGGTYAAWTYYAGAATQDDTGALGGASIETAVTTGSKGTLTVTNNKLAVEIVDDDNNYVGEANFTGGITVAFQGVEHGEELSGIKFTVSVTDASGTFVAKPGYHDAASKTAITAAEIKSALDITLPTLNTLTEYNNYASQIANAKITITVYDKIAE